MQLIFAAPAALLALAALPMLYWLLRATPPQPRRVAFPPLRLLADAQKKDDAPAHMPLWLLLLRITLAAIIILAMSGPVFTPRNTPGRSDGPLLVMLDDGWSAAHDWNQRIERAGRAISEAARGGFPSALMTASGGVVPQWLDEQAALSQLHALAPKPWLPTRVPMAARAQTFLRMTPRAHVLWISDGVDSGDGKAFITAIASTAPSLETITSTRPATALIGLEQDAQGMTALLSRSATDGAAQGIVKAHDKNGAIIGTVAYDFAGARQTRARWTLPVELRNDVTRLDIEGEHHTGATFLLDEGQRRRRIGLIFGDDAEDANRMFSAPYFLRRALAPYADLREPAPGDGDPISHMLDQNIDVLILSEVVVNPITRRRLDAFLADGGVVLRFAGPRTASGEDGFFPVRLRHGGRSLEGALSWDQPRKLSAFDPRSPFGGLTASAEATVQRQVLPEPEPGLETKIWARLDDGTPLVTGETRGAGKLVFFHISADSQWSSLPLSGLFVDMLLKVAALSGRNGPPHDAASNIQDGATLPPFQTLDGFGALGAPSPAARPITPGSADFVPSLDHPPGYYGTADALQARNAASATLKWSRLDFGALHPSPLTEVDMEHPVDVRPLLLTLAVLLALADLLGSLFLVKGRGSSAVSALFLIGALTASPMPSQAQTPPSGRTGSSHGPSTTSKDQAAALSTRLAYVVTGDPRVDAASLNGLTALSNTLSQRTSLEPETPVAIDPAKDELAFYPMIYWPIVAGRPQPDSVATGKINAFMKQGGFVLFDTRDADFQRPNGFTPEQRWLRTFLASLDAPALEPMPHDHVVTKTFYIIPEFVGRMNGGTTYLEALPAETPGGTARPARAGDSVSPLMIVANDLAGGWAEDAEGQSLYPLSTGSPRQHEMALRGGVNIVMYTLTGNYKADQVHVRELLERLGH